MKVRRSVAFEGNRNKRTSNWKSENLTLVKVIKGPKQSYN